MKQSCRIGSVPTLPHCMREKSINLSRNDRYHVEDLYGIPAGDGALQPPQKWSPALGIFYCTANLLTTYLVCVKKIHLSVQFKSLKYS